ncbi:DUF3307 domain-containing protein [Celeribacter sp.]|uniref:DUF3307 domain-containing protein n=1 Tax=Celeribacter sp. TaxID=1890673 RepID=UPI003A940F41
MPETLATLFLAHVLADYVFQTSTMVARKDEAKVLLGHGIIVLLSAMATTGQLPVWPLLLYAGAHFAIDVIKSHLTNNGIAAYLADQVAHLATIGGVALVAPDLVASGAWGAAPAWVFHTMLLAGGLLYVTCAGGFAVEILMRNFRPKDASEGFSNAPSTIGNLERFLVYIFLLAGMPEAIGFIFAAKAIMRFQTLSSQSQKFYESVFIGTLASFGWAIAITIGVMALRDALPAL